MTNHRLVRFDTTALNRALIGFDSLFDNLESRFANQITQNYPPHNVIKHDEDTYEIQMAVTGFDPSEITVEVDQNQLTVKGEHVDVDTDIKQYLHRGLAARNFTRVFPLAEHIEVGEGSIKNGVLTVALKRVVPEELKPRQLTLRVE
jgi:molecular chaperone IbpA